MITFLSLLALLFLLVLTVVLTFIFWFIIFSIYYIYFNFVLILNVSWHASDWQACTKSCGKGSQSKSVVCRANINATHYKIDQSEALCDAAQKPTAFRYCNEVNCPATWKTSWTEVRKLDDFCQSRRHRTPLER